MARKSFIFNIFLNIILLVIHQQVTFCQQAKQSAVEILDAKKVARECENEISGKLETFLISQADIIQRRSLSFDHIREMKGYLRDIKEKVEKLEEVYHVVSGEPRNSRESELFDNYKLKIKNWRDGAKDRDDVMLEIIEFFLNNPEPKASKSLSDEPPFSSSSKQNFKSLHSTDKFLGLRQLFQMNTTPKLFNSNSENHH